MRIVVMGPSGSGKSVVGGALAARRGVPFLDADDLHPEANVAKMAAGTPLDDLDRGPWLDEVAARLASTEDVVIACSALARRYRDRIRAGADGVAFVALTVSPEILARRMTRRTHFMPPALLASQLAALEPLGVDERGVSIDAEASVEAVVDAAQRGLQSLR